MLVRKDKEAELVRPQALGGFGESGDEEKGAFGENGSMLNRCCRGEHYAF